MRLMGRRVGAEAMGAEWPCSWAPNPTSGAPQPSGQGKQALTKQEGMLWELTSTGLCRWARLSRDPRDRWVPTAMRAEVECQGQLLGSRGQ